MKRRATRPTLLKEVVPADRLRLEALLELLQRMRILVQEAAGYGSQVHTPIPQFRLHGPEKPREAGG